VNYVRAQITTRSGPPGTQDAPTVVQGDYRLRKGAHQHEFIDAWGQTMELASRAAEVGLVTEIAVLVYPDLLDATDAKAVTRGQG